MNQSLLPLKYVHAKLFSVQVFHILVTYTIQPPSIVIIWPVMYELKSVRDKTASATSWGVPMRSAGISSIMEEISSEDRWEFILVSIIPQERALTCILDGASSFARALVKELIAPLVAEYATSQDAPRSPHTEEMFIIFPCPLRKKAELMPLIKKWRK